MRRLSLAILALALTGCGYLNMTFGPAVRSWSTVVYGVPIEYRIVAGGEMLGTALYMNGSCRITISEEVTRYPIPFAHTAAHELGHCMDGAHLGWSHDDVTDEGCDLGWDYYCDPKEGFAERYAQLYLADCGFALTPLGIPADEDVWCRLPDPHRVGPPTKVELIFGIGQ